MESIRHPVCPKCESENVTYDFTPAEPDVGIFTAWVAFWCEDCEHDWGCEPNECSEYYEKEEPDEYDQYDRR